MSKVGNFAAGLLGGYVGYKQAQEDRAEREADREMRKAIYGKKDDKAETPAAPVNPVSPGKAVMAEGAAAGDAVSMQNPQDEEIRGFVNGGMVGEMPKQYDRFGWQRQSFKKGTPSF